MVLLLFILAGCQFTPKKTPPNTLRVSFAQDPTTIDPRKSSDFASSTLICLLFEGLTRCTSGSSVELAIAEKVEISKDGKTYRFTLKKTFWTDGRPVTAFDFEQSWKTILTPGFPASCAYLLYPIKNGELYAKGQCLVEEVGIHSIDDLTLLVELENKTPYFLSLTAFPLYLPSPAHLTEQMTLWSEPQDKPLICNGPFIIETMTPGEEIRLKKNDQFWNPNQIHLDQIQINIIANDLTAIQLFEKGELDLVGGPLTPISIDALPQFKNGAPLHFLPMAASTFCTLNTEVFPFSNKALRKAFALAIQNDPSIAKEIEKMGQIQAIHILPPSLTNLSFGLLRQEIQESSEQIFVFGAEGRGCDAPLPRRKNEKMPEDLEYLTDKSKIQVPMLPEIKEQKEDAHLCLEEALKELKITPQDLESLILYYKGSPMEKKIAQTLQRTWEEALGIHIHIEQVDAKSLTQRLYAKNYQLSLASWIAQFHDPINLLERYKEEKNPKNYSGWSSVEYKELLNKASSASDGQERARLLATAETLLEEQTLQIPLYHWRSPMLVHPRVQGLSFTSAGGILIEQSFITESESFSPHH
jgi:oligopeptide transport system substrate-binding protein